MRAVTHVTWFKCESGASVTEKGSVPHVDADSHGLERVYDAVDDAVGPKPPAISVMNTHAKKASAETVAPRGDSVSKTVAFSVCPV